MSKELFEELDLTIAEIRKENQELKKQLENYKKLGFKHLQDKNNNLEAQQKEFIKYLEDGIKSSSTLDTINKQTAMYIYSTTLRKYKETIGDNK